MKTAQEVIDYLAQVSEFRYIAMDEDKTWVAFQEKPLKENYLWHTNGGNHVYLKNIQPATDWKQSLTEAKL
jgi:hypothetical protein